MSRVLIALEYLVQGYFLVNHYKCNFEDLCNTLCRKIVYGFYPMIYGMHQYITIVYDCDHSKIVSSQDHFYPCVSHYKTPFLLKKKRKKVVPVWPTFPLSCCSRLRHLLRLWCLSIFMTSSGSDTWWLYCFPFP